LMAAHVRSFVDGRRVCGPTGYVKLLLLPARAGGTPMGFRTHGSESLSVNGVVVYEPASACNVDQPRLPVSNSQKHEMIVGWVKVKADVVANGAAPLF